ncbi:FAD-dependent oxidoreductase [Pseudomonas sp. FP597]|uniref:FAD-dependent oxidoreductase n=1 Tax=Pseudomonas sp. FP597 TaxID=2954096 RepID=UPI002732DD61|nr:FAD-dependent oxidoreductase [Pseudomonas sp. FP597]WLI04508.1 FAD-dependent oxidoreductase [Pseudomonas sp. FP597]
MALIQRALVVGGGLGGMCAAIQLSKQGVDVELLEINPNWAPDGAGITISGPTLRALRQIGVVDEVLRDGGSWRAMDICDANGDLTCTVPITATPGAEDLPGAAGILRPVLAEILSRATRQAGVRVRLGQTFQEVRQDEDGVDVTFNDGSRGRFDLVIGADGVNSAVRKLVLPNFAGPQFTGQGSWRAVVPRQRENGAMFMGRTTKAGMNPISENECYLFVLDKRADMDFIPEEQWPAMLAELLEEFGGDVGDIRKSLLEGSLRNPRLLYRPLAGHIVDAPWHKGRIVLLGDAVHATTPHLASGAGIAIEGAIVLAEELSHRHSLEAALTAYSMRHFERASLVVHASGRLGQIEQNGGSQQEHAQVMVSALEALRAPI